MKNGIKRRFLHVKTVDIEQWGSDIYRRSENEGLLRISSYTQERKRFRNCVNSYPQVFHQNHRQNPFEYVPFWCQVHIQLTLGRIRHLF